MDRDPKIQRAINAVISLCEFGHTVGAQHLIYQVPWKQILQPCEYLSSDA